MAIAISNQGEDDSSNKFQNDNKKCMKIYYTHAKCTYGSRDEKEDVNLVMKEFPNCSAVDPGTYKNAPEKRNGGM